MNLTLISQILAENDRVQQLLHEQGPGPLLKSYQHIKKLTRRLRDLTPSARPYCLAFTILANFTKAELNQLQQHYDYAGWDSLSRTPYALAFERLQYQTNLAVSMLS
ncbi:hypothetical protein [Spirosoma koreense]